jgi:hypothetical protein
MAFVDIAGVMFGDGNYRCAAGSEVLSVLMAL